MSTDWQRYCTGKSFTVDGNCVYVQLPDGHSHRIEVAEEDDAYRLTAPVARRSVVEAHPDLPVNAWERNRGTELVGFSIDTRGRLVGTGWVPKAGLTAAEFRLYLQTVAAECDRFEFQLTGEDAM